MADVFIISAARTAVGSFQGMYNAVSATKLGSVAVKEAVKRAGVKPEEIDEVIMGNVLTAGTGQAPARQAAIFAGLPNSVCATTISKVCGSGMKAMMIGADAILAGNADLVVAGGMESMTNSPYVIEKARAGLRMGHAEILDTMIKDGLWDVYNNQHMGSCAELCAKEFKFTREDQDKFAFESYTRAKAAIAAGKFKDEIAPVEVPQKKGDPLMLAEDEGPKKGGDLAKMATLKPAFQKDGTVTAANASSINDGAAAVVLASEAMAKKLNAKPLARIVAYAGWAEAPEWFTIAPVGAIRKALEKAKLTKDKIDVWEINEAFAVVTMAAMKKFELDHAKVNPNGGAISLGHPIGASGARIMTTLLYEMAAMKAKYGLATLCIGGGEGTALIVERV